MKSKIPTFNLIHDGVMVAIDCTEIELLALIHKWHWFSLSYAVEHGGYRTENYTDHVSALVGRRMRCNATGAEFAYASDGCTGNYARASDGAILSDAGVDQRERAELLDTSKPFVAYVSGDGKSITGWKGNVLMTVTSSHAYPLTRMSYTHGKTIQSIIARDVHGTIWYGRGNPDICITMRAYKHQPK